MPERITTVGPIQCDWDRKEWGLFVRAQVRVTTPEEEPAVVTLSVEFRLKNPPENLPEELPGVVRRILEDRFQRSS